MPDSLISRPSVSVARPSTSVETEVRDSGQVSRGLVGASNPAGLDASEGTLASRRFSASVLERVENRLGQRPETQKFNALFQSISKEFPDLSRTQVVESVQAGISAGASATTTIEPASSGSLNSDQLVTSFWNELYPNNRAGFFALNKAFQSVIKRMAVANHNAPFSAEALDSSRAIIKKFNGLKLSEQNTLNEKQLITRLVQNCKNVSAEYRNALTHADVTGLDVEAIVSTLVANRHSNCDQNAFSLSLDFFKAMLTEAESGTWTVSDALISLEQFIKINDGNTQIPDKTEPDNATSLPRRSDDNPVPPSVSGNHISVDSPDGVKHRHGFGDNIVNVSIVNHGSDVQVHKSRDEAARDYSHHVEPNLTSATRQHVVVPDTEYERPPSALLTTRTARNIPGIITERQSLNENVSAIPDTNLVSNIYPAASGSAYDSIPELSRQRDRAMHSSPPDSTGNPDANDAGARPVSARNTLQPIPSGSKEAPDVNGASARLVSAQNTLQPIPPASKGTPDVNDASARLVSARNNLRPFPPGSTANPGMNDASARPISARNTLQPIPPASKGNPDANDAGARLVSARNTLQPIPSGGKGDPDANDAGARLISARNTLRPIPHGSKVNPDANDAGARLVSAQNTLRPIPSGSKEAPDANDAGARLVSAQNTLRPIPSGSKEAPNANDAGARPVSARNSLRPIPHGGKGDPDANDVSARLISARNNLRPIPPGSKGDPDANDASARLISARNNLRPIPHRSKGNPHANDASALPVSARHYTHLMTGASTEDIKPAKRKDPSRSEAVASTVNDSLNVDKGMSLNNGLYKDSHVILSQRGVYTNAAQYKRYSVNK